MKNILYLVSLLFLYSCNEATSSAENKLDTTHRMAALAPKLDEKEWKEYNAKIGAFFHDHLLNKGFNGSILVAKNGVIVYEQYQGFADLRTKNPITDSTSLHIASAGKTMTGMAIMLLTKTGKVALEDPITKFFPDLPYPGITVEMLLCHRSGLPNYLHYLDKIKNRDTCYSNQDVLNSLYNVKPGMESRPGTRFHYSNTNFVLLALIIEKVSGMSFPEYMKKTIFDPLQMTHTYVVNTDDPTTVANPSFEWTGAYWTPDAFDCTYGDKNIYTTPRDLLKWDQAMYEGRLFDKTMLDSIFAPRSNERPSIHNYGLAWRMLNLKNGKKVIYHNGRWHGTNASFARLTQDSATIIIIGNKYNSGIYTASKKAYDLFGNYFGDGDDNEEEEGLNVQRPVAAKKRKR